MTVYRLEHAATVVRSDLSDRVWIAHIGFSEMITTQAGPLKAVKAYTEEECLRYLRAPEEFVWRREGRDAWILEWRVPIDDKEAG